MVDVFSWCCTSEYMHRNQGVQIEVEMMGRPYASVEEYPAELAFVQDQMRIRLMAGQVPLLISNRLLSNDGKGYFADWLPLLEAHPGFTDDEWFMSAYRHLANDNGKLTRLPEFIGFLNVSANTKIPGLTERLSVAGSITWDEIIALYHEFGGPESGLDMLAHSYPWGVLNLNSLKFFTYNLPT